VLKTRHLPDTDKISVLAATTLLAYTLTRFAKFPPSEYAVQLSWIYLVVQVDIRTLVSLLVAGLAAAGADWLVHQHPALESRSALQHWWLPALTAWAIGILLYGLPDNPIWWIGLIIGGITLTLVLVAEYITVDPDDIYHPLATAGLTALAFSLFLALSISLHAAGLRVFLLAPTMTITTALVSLRVLLLRLHGRWAIVPALSVALVSGQFSAALHYWPLSSIRFGLMLTGIVYALTGLVANMAENRSIRQTILEPTIICLVLWGAAIWMP
jgi:hypothetical protein